MIKSRIVTKNVLILSYGELFRIGTFFLINIFLARYLGSRGFGMYSYVFSFASFIVILSDFGLSKLVMREVGREKNLIDTLLENIASLKIILSCIAFVIIAVVTLVIEDSAYLRLLIFIASLHYLVLSFNDLLHAFFIAFEKLYIVTLSKIVQFILLLGLVWYAMRSRIGMVGIILCFLVAAIISFGINMALIMRYFKKMKLKINLPLYKSLLKKSLPFALSAFFAIASIRLGVIFLTKIRGASEAGFYSAANSILVSLMVLPEIFNRIIFPRLSYYHTHSPDSFIKSLMTTFKMMTVMSFLIVFIIYLTSSYIISFVYGLEFMGSAYLLSILIWAFLILCINTFLSHVLQSMNHAGGVLHCVFVAFLIDIPMYIILIRKFGMVGACSAFCFSTVLVLFFLSSYFIKHIKRYIHYHEKDFIPHQ